MEQKADSISIIEMELMTLVRQLDTLGRKGSLYDQVDRAGYLALRTLERLGPIRTNALAEALHLDASTVTRQVTALVAGGFVARRPDPADGRSSTLALTAGGRRIMRAVEKERRRILNEMFCDWSEKRPARPRPGPDQAQRLAHRAGDNVAGPGLAGYQRRLTRGTVAPRARKSDVAEPQADAPELALATVRARMPSVARSAPSEMTGKIPASR